MSATALAGAEPVRWPGGVRFADRTIAFLVFLSGFVIVEPSPYDLLLVVVVVVWAIFGLKLNRHFMPMTILMMVYLAGGLLSLTQMDTFIGKPVVYMATTAFLIASSVFFASVIVEDPERRLPLIRKAYLVTAVVVSAIAILAYFNAFPHADYFKLYQRAKGTFQDPNVFGPFLALPATFLVHDILTRRSHLRGEVRDPIVRAVGAWRSLVAHLTGGQGVAGSNPVAPTIISPKKQLVRT